MRAFLEQYGVAIFVLVIVGIMVLMATGVGNTVENLITQEVKRFTDKSVKENKKIINGFEDAVGEMNQYGFYFNSVYIGEWDDGIRYCAIFKEDNTIIWYIECTEEYYNTYKEDCDSEYNTTTYGEYIEELRKDFETYQVLTYDTLYAEDHEDFYYFSDDGKTFYWDEEKTDLGARLVEE